MAGVDHSFLGLEWSDQYETECSHWYRDNVEPTHAHLWIRGGYCRRFGIPGLYGGFACSMGNPLAGLSMNTQREIYEHFADRLEAKQLFVQLGRMDNGSYGKLRVLVDWVSEDYPGPWEEWWESHRIDFER